MSRIGKLPVKAPAGVEIKMQGSQITVKGPKGQLQRNLHQNMKVEINGGELTVIRPSDNRLDKSLHGLTRSLINNMVTGVSLGFTKTLNIVGVGYKVELKGKDLLLQVGLSHPVNYKAPQGIEFKVDPKKNIIDVNGIDKEKVGQVAAEIRSFRPPEPYKGKGIMYSDERIRRKAGKAAASAGKG